MLQAARQWRGKPAAAPGERRARAARHAVAPHDERGLAWGQQTDPRRRRTPACSPCSAAGSYASNTGNSHCLLCNRDYYQPSGGATSCLACPGGSYAHFPGSAVCIACYYGLPVVMADAGGLYTERSAEQPSAGGLLEPCGARVLLLPCCCAPAPLHPIPLPVSPGPACAGFMTAVTSANSPLTSKASCGFSPFTAKCSSLSGRTVAIETDATCSVSLVVLGDSGCSLATQATLVYGCAAGVCRQGDQP